MKNRVLTEAIVRSIKLDYMQGLKRKELSDKYNIGIPSVDAVLRERIYKNVTVEGYHYNLHKIRAFRTNEAFIKQAKELLSQGMNPFRVSKVMGVSPGTIYKLNKKMKSSEAV